MKGQPLFAFKIFDMYKVVQDFEDPNIWIFGFLTEKLFKSNKADIQDPSSLLPTEVWKTLTKCLHLLEMGCKLDS